MSTSNLSVHRPATAGVSWTAEGYQVAVNENLRRRFGLTESQVMIDFLVSLGSGTVAVVESTNGMLDGRLMAAGLQVYRADSDVLPVRAGFGAVAPDDLVRLARQDLGKLTRLTRDRGTQTGREDNLERGIRESDPVIERLIAEGRCVGAGDPALGQVALTFDDGPFQPYTDQILDVLAAHQVRATFFCVGLNVGGHPDVVARIAFEGHELGNHTWSHPFLPELTLAELDEQVSRTDDSIRRASGVDTSHLLFRPPYGSRDLQVASWLGGLPGRTVLWNVEPFDWAMPGSDVIVQRVLDDVRPGSIILLHDGGGDRTQTVAAVGPIIEGVRALGLDFVPVGELRTT